MVLLSRNGVDGDLVEGFLTGDADALRTAWDAWGGMIHRFVARSLPTVADAEDVTQQVFVDAWRGRARFDPELGALPAWLFGIARRKVVDRLRALQRAPLPAGDPDDIRTADSEIEGMAAARWWPTRSPACPWTAGRSWNSHSSTITHAQIAARLDLRSVR